MMLKKCGKIKKVLAEQKMKKKNRSTSNLLLDFIYDDERLPSPCEWRPQITIPSSLFPSMYFGISCMLS